MVNPDSITNYNLNTYGLQNHIIFWLLVAGKNAHVISKRQQIVYEKLRQLWILDHSDTLIPTSAFQLILDLCNRRKGSKWLSIILRESGIGCHTIKARGMIQLAHSRINLHNCSPEDLEKITGIGMKTARCFIMHSRENAQYSGLDTHLLSCLRDLGYEVPSSTPGSKKQYYETEQIFLKLAKKAVRTPAMLDLLIWRIYSSHKHLKPILLQILRRINGQTE